MYSENTVETYCLNFSLAVDIRLSAVWVWQTFHLKIKRICKNKFAAFFKVQKVLYPLYSLCSS